MGPKGNTNIVFSVYSQKQQRSDVQLSERLASLGIMGDLLRAPLKHPVHHNTIIQRKYKYSFPSVSRAIEFLVRKVYQIFFAPYEYLNHSLAAADAPRTANPYAPKPLLPSSLIRSLIFLLIFFFVFSVNCVTLFTK